MVSEGVRRARPRVLSARHGYHQSASSRRIKQAYRKLLDNTAPQNRAHIFDSPDHRWANVVRTTPFRALGCPGFRASARTHSGAILLVPLATSTAIGAGKADAYLTLNWRGAIEPGSVAGRSVAV